MTYIRAQKKLDVIASVAALILFLSSPAHAIEPCNAGQGYNCVVDGDTIRLRGELVRLQGYDTPETYRNICGGNFERRLGQQATARLIELMNNNKYKLRFNGRDRYGRRLATMTIRNQNVGNILIKEQLARSWPNGREFWCK